MRKKLPAFAFRVPESEERRDPSEFILPAGCVPAPGALRDQMHTGEQDEPREDAAEDRRSRTGPCIGASGKE